MPADLSSIIQYTHDCADTVGIAIQLLRNKEKRKDLTCPKLPDRVIGNLQQLIEQLDDQGADSIADLLSCYQIQYSRLSSELGRFNSPERLGTHRIMTEQNMEFTLEQTVKLFLLAESMFKFARRVEENIPEPKFNREQVNNAINILELGDVISDEYSERLLSLLADDNDKNNVAPD